MDENAKTSGQQLYNEDAPTTRNNFLTSPLLCGFADYVAVNLSCQNIKVTGTSMEKTTYDSNFNSCYKLLKIHEKRHILTDAIKHLSVPTSSALRQRYAQCLLGV